MTERQRVVLADWKRERRGRGGVEIEGEGGTVFVIEPPELWPDVVAKLAAAGDTVGIAQALLGDSYDQFVAEGGSATTLMAIYGELQGNPGESSASSSS